jgi:hypothetical protein
MDIRNSNGSRVGYTEGNDIKNSSGSRIGYVDSNIIKDSSGSKVGYVDGGGARNLAAGLALLTLL